MNIITVTADSESLFSKRKFYIDCPVDVESHEPEIRRIEIPRELAVYMQRLHEENVELKRKLKNKSVAV